MHKRITLLFAIMLCLTAQSQDKRYDLLQEKTQTHILYDRVFALGKATEQLNEPLHPNRFKQLYSEMQRSDFDRRLPDYSLLSQEALRAKATKIIPLSVLVTDFESIKTAQLESGALQQTSNNQFTSSLPGEVLFQQHSLSLMSALELPENSTTFILKENFIFNTSSRSISGIFIQDETGTWIQVQYNTPFQIQTSQLSSLEYKITFHNAATQTGSFVIQKPNTVSRLNNNYSPQAVNAITATIPYQGYGETAAYLGQGEYELFLDTTNGVLDKPIFLVDGFDPGDSRNISAIYNSLNYGSGQNLAGDLRALGYDIVILNFPVYTRATTTTVVDGGADFIQRNAFVLVELINQINAQKTGTEQNVIIGPSMGGLISRYALRYMEQNSLTHDTRLYISFDSPHQGANVPIGFQHLFNYMAYGPVGNTTVQQLVDGMIKSPAARQMLIDHMEGHFQSGSAFEFNTATASLLPTGSPNYRDAFQNELNAMGFPANVRNIAISNGAGNGTMNYSPDFEVMNHTFNISSSQRAIINLRFTPAANQQNQVSRFRGQAWLVVWFTVYESLANSKSPTYTSGLDTAPGGRFDMTTLQAGLGTDPLLTEFFDNLNADYFCFIPAWSSMAVSNTNDLYAPITSSTVTPFAASSIPTVNENHVTLNSQNLPFILNEILNPVLATEENPALESLWVKNPVGDQLELGSYYPLENASVTLTDMMGKIVYASHGITITSNVQLPVALQSGMYVLTVSDATGSTVRKVIKE